MNNDLRREALDRARQSLEIESKAVRDILGYFDDEGFMKTLEVLASAGKIITTASGTSSIAARKFSHSLCCIDFNAQFLSPSEAVHGGLGCVKPEDAVIVISRGGKTAELFPIIDVVLAKRAKLIVITENLDSMMAKKADFVIPMKIEQESDPLNIMATSSFIVTVAIFDALLSALMIMTGYKLEQFALIHPGGAVGQYLNK